jgi:4-amino-4-deoxy-L-arabinose transferase-like glycosyltransferase
LPTRLTANVAPPERPLPLWILYPLFFVGVYLAHFSLLRLPYFWDEAGYYIPAALDFFRTGSLIPHSTLTNAHPPLPSILLAAWWRIAGLSIAGTRTFLCMIAAAALLGVFRLARLLAGTSVAITATALTALYPIWFTQSTLAHADLFAAAFTLWALSFYFQPSRSSARPLALATLFTLAVLSKETAIVTPIALALWDLTQLLTPSKTLPEDSQAPSSALPLHREARKSFARLPTILALIFPAIPLALWYAYHHHVTGFTFGNPEFLRYNATANLTPTRILLSFWHRLVHLFFHMNMFVPVVAAIACIPMPRRHPDPPALTTPTLTTLAILLFANAFAFSVLGGALLTRYLLPMYPPILIVCAALWQQRMRHWQALAALSAIAFLLALFINPPYSFAPEDNLTYRDFITLHQRAIHLLAKDFPNAQVLTAWPATAELTYPDLGYVHQPIASTPIDNFALDQIQKAASNPGAYDTAFVFSTKWIPPANAFSFTRHTESTDTRFFDFHRDLTPPEIALLLHGQILWQAHSHGEWAAILRFPRANEASLTPGPPPTPSPAKTYPITP